jgi:DNA-binding XRE family transcriptional regulator
VFESIGARDIYQDPNKITKSAKPGVVSQLLHLQRCYVPKDPLSDATLHAMQRIGRTVASIREWRNLSQEELREASGISYRQIQRIEAGDDVAISFYIRVAKALKVPLETLFTSGSAHANDTPTDPD